MAQKRQKKTLAERGKETRFRSGKDAAEKGRKGGIRSGEVRRAQSEAKKDAKEAARYMLNLAAKGQILSNLEELGVEPTDRNNMIALQARLFTMAMAGNLEAYKELMKTAGYDTEENRRERESINADNRRNAEVQAKLDALGASPETPAMSIGLGNEEGANDVVFYMPKMMDVVDVEVDEPDEETGETIDEE